MSAKSIREYDGKHILAKYFANSEYKLDDRLAQVTKEENILQCAEKNEWLKNTKVVVKPDQLIKRRGKLGLVGLNKDLKGAHEWIAARMGKDQKVEHVSAELDTFIVEPFLEHKSSDEYYVCIQQKREGDEIFFYHAGGVDVGNVDEKAEKLLVPHGKSPKEAEFKQLVKNVKDADRSALLAGFLGLLYKAFNELYFTYMEINPICVVGGKVYALDLAAKLDQTAEFVCERMWGKIAFPAPFGRVVTADEKYIMDLDATTGASLKLTVLNPKGRVWLMVAGGGASVIYTDTVSDLGFAKEICNYGEYSGDPSESLTFAYAKTILDLMTRTEPYPDGKILIIGGGIANFTNVKATFKGIVRAIGLYKEKLLEHKIKIFVRRGGPNYREGLQEMREKVGAMTIPIEVYGPETHMTAIVPRALGLPSEIDGKKPQEEKDYSTSVFDDDAAPPAAGAPVAQEKVPDGPYTLFTNKTRAIVWGMQLRAVQSMLDFDYLCKREIPSVAAIVYPFGSRAMEKFFWGPQEITVPILRSVEIALNRFPDVDVMVNFASSRSAADVTMEAMTHNKLRTIAIIAEGIPEKDTREVNHTAAAKNVVIIGPATVGGIKPGCFRIGNSAGMLDNVVASKLYRPGSVAYVSRSGGMSNELNNIISRSSDGVYEGIAIGGDRYPGTSFMDHILRYEADPGVKMIVVLGEVGGVEEYKICEAVKNKKITKPLVAWCIGTCAKMFPTEVQFGHAGSLAQGQSETAEAKNSALREVGAYVPKTFNDLPMDINKVYKELVKKGIIIVKPEVVPPKIPMDYNWGRSLGLIRKSGNFVSTICDDRGEELVYGPMTISNVFKKDIGIGGVISLLWFRRLIPKWATNFIEMVLQIVADHGPAVSGAHNTIVAARAGKDLMSSLISGMLTIGPRFGGAIDAAANMFSEALDAKKGPRQYVDEMRKKNVMIMGIGHKIKSLENPDMRVAIVKEYVLNNFPKCDVLKYAMEVEKVTTKKKGTLILNVDGCIGVCMVDLLRNCGSFTAKEADEYVKMGFLNGLFILGRSIGFIGHYLDQKRLGQGLYRHPFDDITYMLPDPEE